MIKLQENDCRAYFLKKQVKAMFTSYGIGFCSVSQYYMVWYEHTFSSIFMLGMSLKTLNIIWMCFDGKNNHLEKKQEKVQQQ